MVVGWVLLGRCVKENWSEGAAAAACDGKSVAPAFDKGSAAQQRGCHGSPKTLSCARQNCSTARKPAPTGVATILVISNSKKARGKIECEHVKEDVGECY